MTDTKYEYTHVEGGAPIKSWTRGVPVDDKARDQLMKAAKMPFIFKHVAAMPDVHVGIGATVGSVIPTKGAVIPAAVGVDIGCGMMAARTSLMASDLPDNLAGIRSAIEAAVPHGRDVGRGKRDKGSWGDPPPSVVDAWAKLAERFGRIVAKYPRLRNTNNLVHLGTLGTGNHFIELCLDTEQRVWIMLHSGSRGVGNAIGTFFIELAKQDMRKWHINLPDQDLAYFPEGTDHFDDYVEAVEWAQDFAALNRRVMMTHVLDALRKQITKPFEAECEAVNCHHNYVTRENHFGENVLVTRKGAVRAAKGTLGIIPGSMGAKSFIVRGLGNAESFDSCSHGAGRVMSRTQAKKLVTLNEHIADTAGVECRKDEGVIDETPKAYKPIEAVMAAQADLVEIVHTLKQVVCVKG
ncbi:RtcB family protein, partial [uncultured Sphingobium sp.]|uniref:RtcB family protein n=1 Tax=uncultured Sphingobium sp. TaxID=316087 RepID=UPI000EE27C33|nr:RNA-splicing ligase RtcB [Erythrobacter sp.]|tara:strand:- start:11209 stop:12435 length:1227 start_codon:yes stop_codon:yes gene_type:complete